MEESTKETIEFTITKIQEAALALEPGARHVYEILVRQAYAEGLAELLVAGTALAIMLTAIATWNRVMAWTVKHDVPGILLNVFALFCALLVLTDAGSSAIPHLYNPEYYAIKDLLLVGK